MPAIRPFAPGYGQRIKSARINAGLTQEVLAKKLGVVKLTISYWENERQQPTNYLAQLCDELAVTIDFIVNGGIEQQQAPAFVLDDALAIGRVDPVRGAALILQQVSERVPASDPGFEGLTDLMRRLLRLSDQQSHVDRSHQGSTVAAYEGVAVDAGVPALKVHNSSHSPRKSKQQDTERIPKR